MKLSKYPRPARDNGRGIHWSPGTVHPGGDALAPWLEELQRLNVKWVKLLDDGSGSSLELCRRLVQNEMMPIVRLSHSYPNPGALSHQHEETIRQLIDVGVHYFETNNEPDLPAAWKDARLPPDWLSIVVEQFIYDAERILELGGLPGVPAMSAGSQLDPVSLIARADRSDLFVRGAWIAIHNYALNHPLDYPDDDVNQLGEQITRKEYESLPTWAWDEQPRQLINIWRRQGKQPGQTIEDTADGWRSFELADRMAREALGYSVPVIGTEGGVVVGWRDDRRYPRVTPELHCKRTVEINQFMQTRAPNYLFTVCHWLLANQRLDHQVTDWESQAWFSDWWATTFGIEGRLPTVDAVRDMPSIERAMTLTESEVRGVALDRAGQGVFGVPITLLADGQPITTTQTNARGRFSFSELPGGQYELRAERWMDAEVTIDLAAGAVKAIDLSLEHGHRSAVRGQAISADDRPLANVQVSLQGVGFQRTTTTDESGAYAFEGLGAGTYDLLASGGKVAGIRVDGWNVTRHHIVVPPAPTPRFALVKHRLLDREETDNRHIFFGHVWNERGEPLDGVRIEMSWHESAPGTLFPTAITGSNPQRPAGYYEFVNTPGVFRLRVVSEDIESDLATELRTTDVPARHGEPISYEVDFQRVQEPVIAHLSVIEVNLPGCPESESVQLREAGQRELAPTRRPAPERFLFENLGPGRYEAIGSSLGLIGQVELDGFNPGYVQLPLNGAIEVEISPRAATGRLRLAAKGRGIAREQLVTPGAVVKFEHLPPGAYHLRYLGWHSDPIVLDGLQTVAIRNVDIQLPHESSLEGRVLNADGESLNGQQIVLMAGQEIRGQQITDSRGRYQFAGLPKGEYTLTVEDVGILQPRIELDGQQSIQLDLVAPVEVRPKIIEHYMLLPRQSSPGPWVTLLLLGDYARRLGPAIGFSAKEATLAQRVTIVASLDAIGEDTEQMLLEAGCMVQRLPDESHQLSEALHQALEQ